MAVPFNRFTLTQGNLATKWRVELQEDKFTHTDMTLLSKVTPVPYGEVTGIFKNAEKLFIVAQQRAFVLTLQAGKKDFDYFLEVLLERVKHAHGYV